MSLAGQSVGFSSAQPAANETVLVRVGDLWIALTADEWRRARARGQELAPSKSEGQSLDSPAPEFARVVDANEAQSWTSVPAAWWLAQARAGKVPHFRLGKYVRLSLIHI